VEASSTSARSERLFLSSGLADGESTKYTLQPEQTGAQRSANRGFKDLVVIVVSGMKRGDVVISDLVCVFSYLSYKRSQRARYVSTFDYRLPDNCWKRCRTRSYSMTQTSHLQRVRIESSRRRCRIILTLRSDAHQKRFGDRCRSFGGPESTQSLIPNHAQKFCGSRKQLL